MADDDLAAEIRASFRWAYDIGLGETIEGLIQEGATMDQIVATIRTTPEWQAMFPGFYREDGSKNYTNEAAYLQAVSDYRNVLKDFGMYDPAQDNPQNYVSWMNLQVDPNELQQRLQMYQGLERGSQELRDAFYVYGGMDVSVDDLYRATVDPGMRADMESQYNEAVAGTGLNYELFITRATEKGMEHLTEMMGWLEKEGYAPSSAVQNILGTDPNQMRQFMDVLYMAGSHEDETSLEGYLNPSTDPTGDWLVGGYNPSGDLAGGGGKGGVMQRPESSGYMSLQELITAYTYAMLGSAASEQGLILPGKERLERFVQAGVTRARAMSAYGAYSVAQHGLSSMAARANIGDIDQSLFEEAILLHQGDALATLNKATDLEESLGRAGGGFSTQLDEAGRLVQTGRS